MDQGEQHEQKLYLQGGQKAAGLVQLKEFFTGGQGPWASGFDCQGYMCFCAISNQRLAMMVSELVPATPELKIPIGAWRTAPAGTHMQPPACIRASSRPAAICIWAWDDGPALDDVMTGPTV